MLEVRSIANHLKSHVHIQAQEIQINAHRERNVITAREAAEAEQQSLQHPPHLNPIIFPQRAKQRESSTDPLPEFWENANYNLRDGGQLQQKKAEIALYKDLDHTNKSLWNSSTFARALGMDDEQTPDEFAEWETEEEEILADLLANAGK